MATPIFTKQFVLPLVVGVAVGMASLAAVAWGIGSGKDTKTTTQAMGTDGAKAQLNIPARTVELPSEKARRVREAIKRADYATASQVTNQVFASSQLQNWRYYPFSDFIKEVSDVNDPIFEVNLTTWVAKNKNDAIPLLFRAQYYHDMGWLRRGGNFVRYIKTSAMADFQEYMKKANIDIDESIRLDNHNPYAFYLKLRVQLGFGASSDMKSTFEEAITKYPTYYALYDTVLTVLQPRWGGRVDEMYDFVDQYAGKADKNSPLKLLYLSLYRSLLSSAGTDCTPYWSDRSKMAECVQAVMKKNATAPLEAHVLEALHLYDRSDSYQFSVAVGEILSDMLGVAGGDVYSGAILQLAASTMHSETQLREDVPGHNNYIIDKMAAQSWYQKGFYENSLKKDQEALGDINFIKFPDEGEKDLALAGIYENMGHVYAQLNQNSDMLPYENAAIALGDKTYDRLMLCYGYYKIKDYDSALQECAQSIVNTSSSDQARYWRGVTYRDIGKIDDALKDLAIVADSEDGLRTSAAIDMSMIYFNRNDNRSALDVLSRNKYLYDPSTNSKDGIAVSYNNRCYAYMQLGDFKEALDDCTESLKYGSIPDAYQKQQQLIKQLQSNEAKL